MYFLSSLVQTRQWLPHLYSAYALLHFLLLACTENPCNWTWWCQSSAISLGWRFCFDLTYPPVVRRCWTVPIACPARSATARCLTRFGFSTSCRRAWSSDKAPLRDHLWLCSFVAVEARPWCEQSVTQTRRRRLDGELFLQAMLCRARRTVRERRFTYFIFLSFSERARVFAYIFSVACCISFLCICIIICSLFYCVDCACTLRCLSKGGYCHKLRSTKQASWSYAQWSFLWEKLTWLKRSPYQTSDLTFGGVSKLSVGWSTPWLQSTNRLLPSVVSSSEMRHVCSLRRECHVVVALSGDIHEIFVGFELGMVQSRDWLPNRLWSGPNAAKRWRRHPHWV